MSAVIAIVLMTACGDSVQSPTSPSPMPQTIATRTFAGSLGVGASKFYSFTVNNAGTVTVALASVTSPTGTSLSSELGLGIGVPSGTGCALTQSITTTPALTAQLQHSSTPGVRCVSIFDVGNLTTQVNFAIRFVHP